MLPPTRVTLAATGAVSCETVAAAQRTFAVAGGDSKTTVRFFKADSLNRTSGVPLLNGSAPTPYARQAQLVLCTGQSATFDNADSYIGFTFTGTAPSAVTVGGTLVPCTDTGEL